MDPTTLKDLRALAEGAIDEGVLDSINATNAQRAADQVNADLSWRQRNGIDAKSAASSVIGNAVATYSNPKNLLRKGETMFGQAMGGVERAKYEREEKKAREEAMRAVERLKAEKKKLLDKEANSTDGATNELTESSMERFRSIPILGSLADPESVNHRFTGAGVTGSNVETHVDKTGRAINIAVDYRNDKQRLQDRYTNMAKGVAGDLAARAIDTGLDKAANLAGYGFQKAKYAIADMKEAKRIKREADKEREMVKLRTKQLEEQRRLEKKQQTQ